MDRKERILSYINSKEYIPLKFDELAAVLSVPHEDYEELSAILDELIGEGRIILSRKRRYTPVGSASDSVTGKLLCNPRGFFGFVICDNADMDDIFIAGEDMADALSGDRVLVRMDNRNNSRTHTEGKVMRVLERGNKAVIGVVYRERDGYFHIRPDSRRIYSKIHVRTESASDIKIGDRVLTEKLVYSKDGHIYGEITKNLGDETSLKGITEGIIIGNNIKQEFDAATLREADSLPQNVLAKQTEDREDLRDKLIFTVDGDDARDFDDAVSVDKLDNGNFVLGVHIADVTEYVREGGALDSEAFERGTSVYLADRVIPMLPESLSNGICSLNPKVDRLTLSCFMEIDKNGDVVNNRLSKTVICSKERMTYDNVNKLLEGKSRKLSERYGYMLPTLQTMIELAEILNKKRIRRGAIQFDFPECNIIVDNNGEPSDIVKEIRGVSNKMIEEFMLAANETVAEYAYWSEIPFVYRSHEPPTYDKIKAFNQFILQFGLQIKGKIDEDTQVKPKALQKVLDSTADEPFERIVSSEMLRSLMKAKYTHENLGHFGLAAKFYCHFTSPIRRYPDLAVHRILKKMLDGSLAQIPDTYNIASHSSECEASAEAAERDVDDLMKAAYMSRFVGGTFEGIVANITGFGMFVELENTVEGLIRFENMTGDYYEYDKHSGTAVGRHTGKTYSTGDTVSVVLAKADIMSRQIDFALETDADVAMKKFQPKRTVYQKKNTTKSARKPKKRKKR